MNLNFLSGKFRKKKIIKRSQFLKSVPSRNMSGCINDAQDLAFVISSCIIQM